MCILAVVPVSLPWVCDKASANSSVLHSSLSGEGNSGISCYEIEQFQDKRSVV